MLKFVPFCIFVSVVASDVTMDQGALLGRLDTLEKQVTSFKTQDASLQAQVTSLKAHVTSLKAQVTSLKAQNASLQAQVTSLQAQTQKHGVYVFYFHMRSTNNYPWLLVSIFKDNQELLGAMADGSGIPWSRGNVLVTTHLNAGDKVYCRHTAGSTWLEGGSQTSFSGFLVHAD